MKFDREMTGALDVGSVAEPEPTVPPRKSRRPKRFSVAVGGVRYPLVQDRKSKTWRVRKRTKDVTVDISLGGVVKLEDAMTRARELLGKDHEERTRLRMGGASGQEVVSAYRAMSKRCTSATADANVKRLERVVMIAWEKPLSEVRSADLTARLWEDYAMQRQKKETLDLSTRTVANRGINSAMRMAVSIFHEGLEEGYRRAGIHLDFASIRRVQWLPEIRVKILPLATEAIDRMSAALVRLKVTNRPMWRAIMIAQHAGLRSSEISAARKSWLEKSLHTEGWRFAIHDRPEQGYWHKTGKDYTAPILSKELEEDLLACPDGEPLVPVDGSRDYFFRHLCNRWLRKGEMGNDKKMVPYIAKPHKGMHRLRSLYLERIKDERASQIRELAERGGIEAARQAAGHTSSKTTTTHYLPQA